MNPVINRHFETDEEMGVVWNNDTGFYSPTTRSIMPIETHLIGPVRSRIHILQTKDTGVSSCLAEKQYINPGSSWESPSKFTLFPSLSGQHHGEHQVVSHLSQLEGPAIDFQTLREKVLGMWRRITNTLITRSETPPFLFSYLPHILRNLVPGTKRPTVDFFFSEYWTVKAITFHPTELLLQCYSTDEFPSSVEI